MDNKVERILIVGNGCILIGKELGDVINSYDTVIRFNNFELNEENRIDFGDKTDVWIMNGRHYNECILRKYKNITNVDYKRNIETKIVIGKSHTKKETFKFWENMKSKYHEMYNFKDKYISSGLLAILMYLENYEQVYIVNCDFFSNKKKYKYFSNNLRTTLTHHNWKLEKSIVKKLIKENKVIELVKIL